MAPRLHALLEAYGRRIGIPILLNTSFNVAGEPIVTRALEGYTDVPPLRHRCARCRLDRGASSGPRPPESLKESGEWSSNNVAVSTVALIGGRRAPADRSSISPRGLWRDRIGQTMAGAAGRLSVRLRRHPDLRDGRRGAGAVHLRDLLNACVTCSVCPVCRGSLSADWICVRAAAHGSRHPDGIPDLRIAGDERTEAVRQFYEQAPFPAYPARDSLSSLRARAERSRFAAAARSRHPRRCAGRRSRLRHRSDVAVSRTGEPRDRGRRSLACRPRARRRGGAALRHRQRPVRRDRSPPSRPEIRRLRRGVFVGGPPSHAESANGVRRARATCAARRDRRGRRVQHRRPRAAAAPKDRRPADRAASRAVRSRAAGTSPRRRASRRVAAG